MTGSHRADMAAERECRSDAMVGSCYRTADSRPAESTFAEAKPNGRTQRQLGMNLCSSGDKTEMSASRSSTSCLSSNEFGGPG